MNVWEVALRRPDNELELGRIAFLIAQGEYPDLDVDVATAELDQFAAEVAAPSLAALDGWMFETRRFIGNAEHYYDPRNSYLCDVIERRTGIPISLSLLYIEVGRRAGLDLAPVSFPGHFLVRHSGLEGEMFVDVFNGGLRQTRDVLHERLVRMTGGKLPDGLDLDRMFAPCGQREVVARMLRNLKQIYAKSKDVPRCLRVCDQLLHVEPGTAGHYRDRGYLYAQVGHREAALADYSRYLKMAPGASDGAAIRAWIVDYGSQSQRLN